MRADVGEAPHLALLVARKQERLIQQAGEKVARRERAGLRDIGEVAQELPAAREHALAHHAEGDRSL